MTRETHANLGCVAIGGRGVLIEGPPGSGKSTLALALIDRGAMLVGDDGVTLEARGGALWADPPPNIAGRLELRGIGLIELPCAPAPIHLLLTLGDQNERLPETLPMRQYCGLEIPALPFAAHDPLGAMRTEYALALHGLR